MTSKPFSDDAFVEPSEHSIRAQSRGEPPKLNHDPTAKYGAVTDTWTLTETHWVMQPEPGKVLRVKLPDSLAPSQGEAFKGLEELKPTEPWKPTATTPAGRFNEVVTQVVLQRLTQEQAFHLLQLPLDVPALAEPTHVPLTEAGVEGTFYCECGHSWHFNSASTLVDCRKCSTRWTRPGLTAYEDWTPGPAPRIENRAEWLASLKVGDRVGVGHGEPLLMDPTFRGPGAVFDYEGPASDAGQHLVSWPYRDSSWGKAIGVCHESQLVKP